MLPAVPLHRLEQEWGEGKEGGGGGRDGAMPSSLDEDVLEILMLLPLPCRHGSLPCIASFAQLGSSAWTELVA